MVQSTETVLTVTFGPAAAPIFSRALAYAEEHADDLAEVAPGTFRATFILRREEARFGRALVLLGMVGGWRATTVEVAGSPELPLTAQDMAHCAREWLRRMGGCRQILVEPLPFKCRCCPLYDAGWAAECAPEPEPWASPLGESPLPPVPDHLPEDWDEGWPAGP